MKNSSIGLSPAEKKYVTAALALSWGQGQAKGRRKPWGLGHMALTLALCGHPPGPVALSGTAPAGSLALWLL